MRTISGRNKCKFSIDLLFRPSLKPDLALHLSMRTMTRRKSWSANQLAVDLTRRIPSRDARADCLLKLQLRGSTRWMREVEAVLWRTAVDFRDTYSWRSVCGSLHRVGGTSVVWLQSANSMAHTEGRSEAAECAKTSAATANPGVEKSGGLRPQRRLRIVGTMPLQFPSIACRYRSSSR
jgi:hypothetical protein